MSKNEVLHISGNLSYQPRLTCPFSKKNFTSVSKMKKALGHLHHQFSDEIKNLKENILKHKSGKIQEVRWSEQYLKSNMSQTLSLDHLRSSTSNPIKYESEQNTSTAKRNRGRPRIDYLKPKIVSDIKTNGERTGKRRGRPSKSKIYDGRSLSCGLCDFTAEDLYDLEGHLKLHSNQTVYECRFCNSKFSQKGNLITHIRTHTKERPFKCLFCHFAASQKINLQVHIRTHTKEKPFKCSVCDFSTAQKCNLVAHITRRHSNVEVVKSLENYDNQWGNTEPPMKYYRCGACMFSCRLKRDMVNHIKIQHPYSACEYQTIDVLK